MDKANIIISVIIVLCIAAAVAAYGITNSDNPIFSDLSSMSSNNNGNGLGNNTTNPTNTSSVAVTNGGGSSSSGSGSGASSGSSYGGSSSSSSSGSSYNSGSSYSGSNSNSGSSSSGTSLSYSTAQSIANSAVGEPGCYAGSVYYSGGYWYATIYDEDGNAVDSIMISDATGSVSRG